MNTEQEKQYWRGHAMGMKKALNKTSMDGDAVSFEKHKELMNHLDSANADKDAYAKGYRDGWFKISNGS